MVKIDFCEKIIDLAVSSAGTELRASDYNINFYVYMIKGLSWSHSDV